ncbi:MAG TPA: DUF3237 family protein [Polyangiaceae bacterium]|nr:DUF3237 family protein [Polyangiaceae bacterium]
MHSIPRSYAAAPTVGPKTKLLFCYLASIGFGGLAGCSQSDPGVGSAGGATAQAGDRTGSGSAGLPATAGGGVGGSYGGAAVIPTAGANSAAGSLGSAGGSGSGGVSSSAGSPGAGGAGGATSRGGAENGGSAGSGSGSGSDSTIVPDPSWTCGMPEGIPSPTAGTLVFSASLTVSATHDVGTTQFGKRRQLDVSGGTITGDKLKGTVLAGGLDYELTLSTGAMELEEVLIYKTSDNTSIFVRNCGVAAAGDQVVRIVPDIEAPTSGSYSWLNTTKLVGTRAVSGNKITLDIYDVSKVVMGSAKVQLKDPSGVPNQTWDCVNGSGTKGDSVFTENVTLGSSFSVSNAKRGSRNIIPITGGTTTGKVAGKILDGGADYQLAGSSGTTLDARYTLAPSDGSFIIVRNCGPINSLVPAFEAAADGPYKFLNDGKFLSSAPGSGAGGVSITFYERK